MSDDHDRKYLGLAGVAALLLLSIAARPAAAQVAQFPSGAKAPAWDTLPNWNGVWERDGHIGWDPRLPFDQPQVPPYTPEYMKQYEARQAAARAAKPIADNGARCVPGSMPSMMTMVFPMEIEINTREVMILGEGAVPRRIYIDGRLHPADPFPSLAGHSIGHWKGHTLFVDTCCVKDTTNLPGGGPHSDALHVTEKIWASDANTLKDDITIEDPKALTKPWMTEKTYRRRPDWEPVEYVCEENNRNPVGEDGVTTVVLPDDQK